jgi:putative ABC transport system permease protein
VGIAFILPSLLGIMHGVMGIKALEAFMHATFTLCILIGICCFVIVMFIFYVFINKKYADMVYEG